MALKEAGGGKVEFENDTSIFNIGVLTRLFLPSFIITIEEFLLCSLSSCPGIEKSVNAV